ncbi:MAG TPA: hypothetical protein VJ417_17280, partial [Candidatus Glassbacteria bacterium]|nr:hypothetical protein [Candidatus Glassbacteria bacterium]
TRTLSQPDSTAPAGLYPYWDAEVFRSDEPVLFKRYRLEVPESFPEPQIVTGNGLETVRKELDVGLKAWAWEVHDMPMIQDISYMPPEMTFSPFLVFSNVSSWELAGRWLAEQFYPAAEPDEAVSRKAAELLKDCLSRADSVRSLALFVTIEVRNIGLPLGVAGYEPTAAGKVLQNMYGHELDKAVLLNSLLAAAGIESYPAFGSASQVDLLQLDVPSLAQFGRVAVFIPGHLVDSTLTNPLFGQADAYGLWLFPTAQYNRYGYFSRGQGTRSLVVLPSGGTICRTGRFPPEKSLSLTRARLVLADNGDLSGGFETVTDGLFDFSVRASYKDLTPRELQQRFQQAANAIGEGTRLRAQKISDLDDLAEAAGASIEFDAPELGVVQGDMMIVRLPAAPFSFAHLPYYPELETREYDFVASGPFTLASELEIELPQGWKVAYMPATEKRESPFGRWLISCGQNAGRLSYSRRLSVSATVVSLRDYPEFKAFCEEYTLPRYSILLLERTAPKSGH